MIAGDGFSAPFTGDATEGIRAFALRAREAGVRVHAFALAGHAEDLSPLARELAERTHGSIRRVPTGALDNDFFAAVRLPVPESVTIYNPRTEDTTRARLDADGRFRAAVPMAAGDNPLRIVATTTSRGQGELDWKVRYDATAARDAFLEGERARIRRVRARNTQNGIMLDRVTNSKIYDNDCSVLSGWGLAMWRCSRNLVSRNAFDFCVRGYSHGVYNRGQDSAGIMMFEQNNDNIIAENPDKELLRLCSHRCPHMNQITLEDTLDALENVRYEIELDTELMDRARASLDRMLEVG